MATEGEPPQGGHELDFGSGSQDPTPPSPAAPPAPGGDSASVPPAAPEQPHPGPEHAFPPPGQPSPPQPYSGQPGQPYGAQPGQPYPGQPAYAGQTAPTQPGQAYPAQPGQAYTAQPGQAYAGQPYAAQASGPQPPRKSSKGLLWGLIGGGAALLIAAILVVALLVVPAITRSSVTAADTVKAYLTAVSQGDAKAALGYLEGVSNKQLLTDAVLNESNKLAPITHISVAKGGEGKSTATVIASYRIGDKAVSSMAYEAYRIKDAWKIVNGVSPVSLDGLRGLDATFNGVPTAKITDAYVFPGTYEIALDSKYFSIDGDATFTIASPEDAAALYDVKTALNDAGVTEFRSLVRSAVEACVAMKTLATPCGMDITAIDLSGATPVEGTVTRTLTADGSAALGTLKPESSGSSPTVVSSYDSISVDMTLQGSDGQTYSVTFGGYLSTPTVDFGAASPTVTWE